jgi:Putative peptidoglycan binding domain
MKTKFLWIAFVASAAMVAQAKAQVVRRGAGGVSASAVPHVPAAAPASARPGRFSSFRSMPVRGFGGMIYPSQRYSSFRMRSVRSSVFRRPYVYSNRATFMRSRQFTAATVNQRNYFRRVANYRNQPLTNLGSQPNGGSQSPSGNNHLRADWRNHVFAQHPASWHPDWDRHSDHWWNGHRCHFFNGSRVIFNIGFYPWWPSWYYPGDYYYSGYPYYGYYYPYSYDHDPGYYDSGGYQGQMYYDQNSYPDQSEGYYDSSVYRREVDTDQNGYQDYSNYMTVVAAQERLARQGYYHGETDGVLSPEMQKALKHYQITNGLRATGYLDTETLSVMGFGKGASY